MGILKSPYFMIAVAMTLGVTGQFLFKSGLAGKHVELSPAMIRLFFTPHIFMGLVCYFASTFFYLSALSKLPLSIAYPLISITYILVFIVSIFFLGEKYSHVKLLGNIFIIAGVILINMGK